MTIKWLGKIVDQKNDRIIRKCEPTHKKDGKPYYVVIEDNDPQFKIIGSYPTLAEAREHSGIYATERDAAQAKDNKKYGAVASAVR